ncbi:hypothetical protein EVAR_100764_1 [Eumeta japonica]|uniref:Uncharacterized protein n=1 Tax=Eumeta variegata TaxID=151549 RepID=A0A4C1ST29_EUMVA|nr:hypothetical protein EVAR_100764_1 [Eumeta japonica]
MVTGAHIFRLMSIAARQARRAKVLLNLSRTHLRMAVLLTIGQCTYGNHARQMGLSYRSYHSEAALQFSDTYRAVEDLRTRKGYSITYMNYRRLTKCTCLLSKSNRCGWDQANCALFYREGSSMTCLKYPLLL